MKRCPDCGELKPATFEFWYRNRATRDGLDSYCRPCSRSRVDAYQAANVDKVRERKQARRKADWADPDRRRKDRDRQFRWKYGITHDEYDQRLADQGGRCAICGGTDPRGRKGGELFAVDHDHETGAVRGLLCIPCNSGLGQFGDDPDTMLSAATYVMQTRDVLGPIRT